MEEYLKLAVLEAQEGLKNNDGGPFGAVINLKMEELLVKYLPIVF